jgi:hypothetical protein
LRFKALKAKYLLTKEAETKVAMVNRKIKLVFNALKMKYQQKRMIEAAEIYFKRQQYLRFKNSI